MLNAGLALLLGYLLGSIPSAYLVARLKGKNVFEVGSGNMGAMNTARNLGMGLGVIVLLMDIAKGALASYLGLLLILSSQSLLPAVAAGLGAVLGHAFSVFIGFKGGKALATTFGVSLPLYPVAGGLGLVTIILLTLLLKKRSNLAAVITVILYPFWVWLSVFWLEAPLERVVPIVISAFLIVAVVIYKHLPSLKQELVESRGDREQRR